MTLLQDIFVVRKLSNLINPEHNNFQKSEVFLIAAKYPHGTKLVYQFVTKVFHLVDQELAQWADFADHIPDPILRQQALSSIHHKKFHAQGGSVYALYPKADIFHTVKFIVAFQTISDYLDNLCDRAGVEDEASFRQLHQAMLDAIDINKGTHEYYSLYPYREDNGYLLKLVQTCQDRLHQLPSYYLIRAYLEKYVRLYTDLQAYKHLQISIRENFLSEWAKKESSSYPGIFWWEFSAATGSTLGIFLLIAAATEPELSPPLVELIDQSYFPWVCGLHILLDYYIDSQEDIQMGDLNFTHYYNHLFQCEERLTFFIRQSLKYSVFLKYRKFHRIIIQGLLAMYLSDKKALTNENLQTTKNLLKKAGLVTGFYYNCCLLLRRYKIL